jgi:protein-tyrosine phosphatase
MPLRPVAGVEPIVRAIMARGHRVLLAHPERSPACQREPALVDRLVAAGALAQLTAGSFEGRFGRIVQRFSQRLADLELVHVVASDAHDVARRGPGLRAALEAAGLEGRLEWLTGEVPAAILEGGAIPRRPSPGLRPRRWRLPVRRRAPDVS